MRWLPLAAIVGLAACGRGRGYLEARCSDDRDCEPGLSCQDPNGITECYPDGTIGCRTAHDCPSDYFCAPYGTGAFCRPSPTVDLSVDDAERVD